MFEPTCYYPEFNCSPVLLTRVIEVPVDTTYLDHHPSSSLMRTRTNAHLQVPAG